MSGPRRRVRPGYVTAGKFGPWESWVSYSYSIWTPNPPFDLSHFLTVHKLSIFSYFSLCRACCLSLPYFFLCSTCSSSLFYSFILPVHPCTVSLYISMFSVSSSISPELVIQVTLIQNEASIDLFRLVLWVSNLWPDNAVVDLKWQLDVILLDFFHMCS